MEKANRRQLGVARCMAATSLLDVQCSSKIVSAHTISRSAALARIARDGHVYGVLSSFSRLEQNAGRFALELVGINKLSTFDGFCSAHDNQLFKAIDYSNAGPNTRILQPSRLPVRLCKELYLKQQLLVDEGNLKLLEQGRSFKAQQGIRAMMLLKNAGMSAAIRELHDEKQSLETEISVPNRHAWSHLMVMLNGNMPLLVSSCFQPTKPCMEKRYKISDLSAPAQGLTFSAIPTETGGCFVLSWRACHLKVEAFIDSLLQLPIAGLPTYLVGLTFEMCENIAVNPKWWESLNRESSEALLNTLQHGVSPWNEGSSESSPMRLLQVVSAEVEIDGFLKLPGTLETPNDRGSH